MAEVMHVAGKRLQPSDIRVAFWPSDGENPDHLRETMFLAFDMLFANRKSPPDVEQERGE
jgi:hypothetical protein